MLFQFGAKSVVGLDIGSSILKAVQLKKVKENYELEAFDTLPLLPEVIIEGSINESMKLIDSIKELYKKAKIKSKNVVISISGHSSVIIKRISLPQMTEDELNESIKFEAEQYMPFDIDDVNLDFQIIGPSPEEEGQMDVVLVALKKDIINEYINVIKEAGLNPIIVDIDSLALENMYELNYGLDTEKCVALVNIGASSITINMLKNGAAAIVRENSIGSNLHTEALQNEFGLTFEAAERLKRGEAVENVTAEEADMVLRGVSEEIISDIVRSMEYFTATYSSDAVDEIYLAGGGALISGFSDMLSEQTGIEVTLMDPFKNIKIPKKFENEMIQETAPTASIAVGLAIRSEGDR